MGARTKDRVAMNVTHEMQAASSLIAALSTDDDTLRHDMVEGETGLFEAVEAAIAEIDECEIIGVGLDAKIGELEARKKRTEARVDRLRGLIEQAMLIAELPSMKLAVATLSVKAVPPKPIYEDEAAIPADYWRQPDPVLDRKKIAEAIKGGATIPGVSLTNGTTSLQIRRS